MEVSLEEAVFFWKVEIPTQELGKDYDAEEANLKFSNYPARKCVALLNVRIFFKKEVLLEVA